MTDELVKRFLEQLRQTGGEAGVQCKDCLPLADAIEALTAERDRLREALDGLLTLVEHANFEEGWCCCGDDMLHHQSPMDCGHTPVDMGEYHASLAIKEARAALKGDSHE